MKDEEFYSTIKIITGEEIVAKVIYLEDEDKVMLENKGFKNITITPYEKYYRVRLNGFETIGEANLISKKIKDKTGIKVWIIENE